MDAAAFDRLSRTLSTAISRRATLAGLLAAAGSALSLSGGQQAGAQGCFANGTRCSNGTECCSGRCRRRNDGKKVCRRAASQGECTVEDNVCLEGLSVQCGTDGTGTVACRCFVTTTGRSFCGLNPLNPPTDCDCASNRECEQSLGKGAKCVQVASSGSGNFCGCPGSTTGCRAPCPNLDPVP
jgi:hypothetical protein